MNVLAIAAHADDVELGMGGTIAMHTTSGDNVCLLLITHSEYRSYDGTLVRPRETARREAEASAKILGIDDMFCLEYETKEVEYNVGLIEDIDRIIGKTKPDIVYTHWAGDVNQDHSAIAQATAVAARNIPRVLMYRSNWYKALTPFDGTYYVDITPYLDTKIEAIAAHQSEVEKRGPDWIEFFKAQCRLHGIEIGVKYAENFKMVKWLA
tara:strand:+ start:9975 stop:10604 length:630 start_codon:yes stop_codon:yes gene_type:complete